MRYRKHFVNSNSALSNVKYASQVLDEMMIKVSAPLGLGFAAKAARRAIARTLRNFSKGSRRQHLLDAKKEFPNLFPAGAAAEDLAKIRKQAPTTVSKPVKSQVKTESQAAIGEHKIPKIETPNWTEVSKQKAPGRLVDRPDPRIAPLPSSGGKGYGKRPKRTVEEMMEAKQTTTKATPQQAAAVAPALVDPALSNQAFASHRIPPGSGYEFSTGQVDPGTILSQVNAGIYGPIENAGGINLSQGLGSGGVSPTINLNRGADPITLTNPASGGAANNISVAPGVDVGAANTNLTPENVTGGGFGFSPLGKLMLGGAALGGGAMLGSRMLNPSVPQQYPQQQNPYQGTYY